MRTARRIPESAALLIMNDASVPPNWNAVSPSGPLRTRTKGCGAADLPV